MRISTILLALLTTSCACTQKTKSDFNEVPPSPPLPEGDGLGTPLGDLCQHLRDLKCKEGTPRTLNGKTSTCYQAFTVAARTAPFDLECSMKASTPEAIRTCGNPRVHTTIRCPAAP